MKHRYRNLNKSKTLTVISTGSKPSAGVRADKIRNNNLWVRIIIKVQNDVILIFNTGNTTCVRKGGKCQYIINRCSEYQRGLCYGIWTRLCCINIPGLFIFPLPNAQ